MDTFPQPLPGAEPPSGTLPTPAQAARSGASAAPAPTERPEPFVLSPATPADRLRLALLLLLTTIAWCWRLGINAMANPFYAAATWAGTRSWKALLFGSVDPSNFITVDKPPVSQWIMGISGRIFGFSSLSMDGPQVLLGVCSVALVYATATRVAGRAAGLIAGAAFALTPVVTMMFRYNNPDAAMVFFMVLAAWATVVATQKASGRWVALAGAALGFAFLAKMLEGLMSLPALLLLHCLCAQTSWPRKIRQLLGAFLAMLVSGGWYVLLTILWPAASRPYLAGSTDNSFLNLVFGYNGLARVQGRSGQGSAARAASGMASRAASTATGAARARAAGGFGGMGQSAGATRLFHGEFGLEISWLVPAALVALAAVLVLRRRAARTDLVRGTALMAGAWMVVDGIVLSWMNGTTHAYYTMAIAPAIALCVGIGAVVAWRRRDGLAGRAWTALIVAAAAGWGGWLLLSQAPGWQPWIGWGVVVLGTISAVLLLVPRLATSRAAAPLVALALVAALGAPAAISLNSLGVAHTGGSPSVIPAGVTANAQGAGRRSGTGAWTGAGGSGGDARTSGTATAGGFPRSAGAASAGSLAGMGGESLDNPQLVALLKTSTATWAAATTTTSAASQLELAARVPVMGIGGFTGTDPAPTLQQFQADVKAGRVGWFVVAGGGLGARGASGARAGDSTASGRAWGGVAGGMRGGSSGVGGQILTWVKATFQPTTLGGATVYKLS